MGKQKTMATGLGQAIKTLLLPVGIIHFMTFSIFSIDLTVSEIMYHPAGDSEEVLESGEYIELHNFGNTPISLAGFEFDRGIQFQFPADAEIQAKGYTVIAGSPDRIRADHLISDVSGPYTGRLSNSGERLRLIDAQSNTVFSFRYRDHGDWPAAADGTGHSLILDGNKTDPDNPRNWSASRFIGGSPGGIDDPSQLEERSETLIEQGSNARYFKGRSEPSGGTTEWAGLDFTPGSNWNNGPSGFGYSSEADERVFIQTTLNDMRNNYVSLYTRHRFAFSAEDLQTLSRLELEMAYDDGFVVYLNGQRIASLGVSGNPPPCDAIANAANDYTPETFDLMSRVDLLREGTNILAIQGHNGHLSNSSDFVLSPTFTAEFMPEATVDDMRRLIQFNEILAASGPDPDWIEFYNPTDSPIDLSGCWLSDDADQLAQFEMPAGTEVEPKGFLAISQDTFGFGLTTSGESLFLSEPNLAYVLEAYGFGQQAVKVSLGRFPDGKKNWFYMGSPSPGMENPHPDRFKGSSIIINEIMYHSPLGSRFEYVELFNESMEDVDLSAWRFQGIEFTFPNEFSISGEGYVLIGKDRQVLGEMFPAIGSLIMGNYGNSLSNNGERISLLNGDDVVMDTLRYEDRSPWPLTADGLGASLERSCLDGDSESPENWRASPPGNPSPLQENSVTDCNPQKPLGVVVSEIMYHPFNQTDDERRTEFIEIFNSSAERVDLENWILEGDVRFLFPRGLSLEPDTSLIIGNDPDQLKDLYQLSDSQVTGPWENSLPNGSGLILLIQGDGRLADLVDYDDDFPWPSLADGFGSENGKGFSMERIHLGDSAESPSNWKASPENRPSPGKAAFSPEEPLPSIEHQGLASQPVSQQDRAMIQVDVTHSEMLQEISLEYWLDDPERIGETRTTLPMQESSPESLDNDFLTRWIVELPQFPANSIIRYRIRMKSVSNLFIVSPSPQRDAFLWHGYFVDPMVDSSLPNNHHLFLSSANWKNLHTWTAPGRVPGGSNPNPNWNNEVPAVFVADGIVYDVSVRHQGSRWGRNGGGNTGFNCPSHLNNGQAQVRSWRIRFPSYRRYDGIDVLILQKRSGWPQHISFRMFELAGVPAPNTSWAKLRINGCDYNNKAFQIERPGRDMVARWFNEVGDLYKSQGFTGDEGPWSWGDERLIRGRKNGFNVQERYEFTYNRKTRGWLNDPQDGKPDFVEPMIEELHRKRSQGKAALRRWLEETFDVNRTLRYICTINYVGTFDDMFQNHYLYRDVETGKWSMFPWDMDNTLGGAFGGWNANPFRGADENRIGNVGNRSGWWNRLKDSFFIAFEEEFLDMFLVLNNTVHSPESMKLIIDAAAAEGNFGQGSADSLLSHFDRRHNFLNDWILQGQSGQPELSFEWSEDGLRILWPAEAIDYQLQDSFQLQNGWSDNSEPVFPGQGRFFIEIEPTVPAQFFRLRKN
ncbi:MAG TPA: hypothetical protein EYQ50_24140 [Verrucomicrobiales bacterium]|nr:hypothetical protein [Verrucomicrobiales bacterium]